MGLTMTGHNKAQHNGQAYMRPDLSRELETRAFQLEQYLTVQHAITEIIARSSDLDAALPRILQAICENTDWDFGEVWYLNRSDNRLYCTSTWCTPSVRLPKFEKSGFDITFESGIGLPGRVLATGKPAWVTNVVIDSNFLRAHIAEQDGVHGALGIPIRTEGEVIGTLTFFSQLRRRPDRELLQMLDTVGSQIGLFVERKRIEQAEREQARQLAALEERQRLARDLHDSVTQTLFSASVIAEMLPILWDRQPDQIEGSLNELNQLTRGALTEMRALLVELRPASVAQGDLGELLKDLTDALTARTKIAVDLDVTIIAKLPPDDQLAVYRIAQEALNNIVKHANAKSVSVQFRADGHAFTLNIRDDGHGFDPAAAVDGHFGQEVMRERAEGIGAHFQVNSAPGAGTTIAVIRSSATE